MVTCYLGLGSNLGNRKKNIRLAIDKVNKLQSTKVMKTSSLIETLPVGGIPQGKYLNAAVEIQTDLTPKELLVSLQDIEKQLGRKRLVKNGPRTIDLDILFFGRQKINEANLIVPHPRIREREFVLRPLGEIAQDFVQELLHENN